MKKAAYVPAGVQVRSRIDEYFFTGNIPSHNLDRLNDDSLMESFAAASRKHLIR